MADVVIVGDGPAGLSAALFLAKRGKDVVVLGQNQSWMHKAMLYNYLGIDEIPGPEFMETARAQVTKLGARLELVEVTGAERTDGGFAVTDSDGHRHEGQYLVLATGKQTDLARGLGVPIGEDGSAEADRDGRTAVPGLYCAGRTVRPDKVQAVISAGDGAAAALDILSQEAGKAVHDFDSLKA